MSGMIGTVRVTMTDPPGMRENLSTPRISLSLRAKRSNLHPAVHVDGDCRVASLLAMTGKLSLSTFARLP